MSLTDPLKRGMVIRYDGRLYSVDDFHVAQAGKQKPTVHVRLRSLKDGHTSERTLDQLGKIDEVDSQVRKMQYLYAAGDEHVFMDAESFDQFSVGKDVLQGGREFLVEQETYTFLVADGQVVGLQLPDIVVMEVAETAPVEHAGGHSSVQKEATMACGLTINVPLFIKTGDKIRVSTVSRQYLGKEKEH